eukprot:763037-Hanusia_phi.AAC.1
MGLAYLRLANPEKLQKDQTETAQVDRVKSRYCLAPCSESVLPGRKTTSDLAPMLALSASREYGKEVAERDDGTRRRHEDQDKETTSGAVVCTTACTSQCVGRRAHESPGSPLMSACRRLDKATRQPPVSQQTYQASRGDLCERAVGLSRRPDSRRSVSRLTRQAGGPLRASDKNKTRRDAMKRCGDQTPRGEDGTASYKTTRQAAWRARRGDNELEGRTSDGQDTD